MRRSRNGFINNLRYLCMLAVVFLGLVSIVGSNGGGGGGGDGENGGGNGGDGGNGGNGAVQYTLTVNTVGQGSVSLDPSGGTYDEGTVVTLTAQADSGWEFSGWSGDLSGSNATETITMDSDKTVTATFTEVVVQDTQAPTWAGASLTAEDIGATFLTLKWSEAVDNVGVTAYRIFRDSSMEETVAGDKTSYAVTGLSRDTEYTFRVEAGDAAGNWSEDISKAATTAADLPQDPKDTAPELSATATTSMSDASAFLYAGPDAVQKGVEPGTIKDSRVAVIRGRVVNETGQPITEVTVSILGMLDLGRTTTRADGAYDIAVNGGGLMKVFFEKEGLLPVKRQLDVPWKNYVHIDDVVMIPRDGNVKTVQLNSAIAQEARGSVVTDADGTRQGTLVVPQAVSGELVMPDGTRQALSTMDFRVTEFTEGDGGPKRMPAEMPANIAYTYAMDLSTDEARAAGAEDVEFDKPVYYYLENFLGFPAGVKVPTGYYDEERGVWVASESGLVIKIIDNTGTTVTVDTDGDDSADDAQTLADLGFTDEELAKLAELYAAGDTLWRVPITHFSSWDCNFGAWPPEDAEIPWFKPDKKHRPDPCKSAGSIIDTSNMALGETVALAGLPFDLHYYSNRVPGYANTREITLRDENAPASLEGIKLELEVAGQSHSVDFPADPDPDIYVFTWDGKDGYGRDVQGSVPMIVKVGYVYDGVYEPNDRWGDPGDVDATEIGDVSTRQQIGLWNTWTVPIGGLDPQAQGLGGWSLAIHHFYDSASQILYCGDGRQHSAEELDPIIVIVAGTGEPTTSFSTWNEDGMKATEVKLGVTYDIAVGPDGSLYIADAYRGVFRVTPDGIINRVAGGAMDYESEGIDALEAFVSALAVDIGPDESIYISEGDRIRKVGPDGRINTIAGNGDGVYGPEGGPALGADFYAHKIALAPDGNLYLLDNDACVIRKVGTDGLLTTFAGTPGACGGAYTGEGGRARDATFSLPWSIAMGQDGSLYVADMGAHRVLRIDTRGFISTAAGTGTPDNTGDGGPAVSADLYAPTALGVGPDNALYIGSGNAVRRVGPDGIISTIAGGEGADSEEEGVPARQAAFGDIWDLDMGPDKNLYVLEPAKYWVRQIGTSFGSASGADEISIADKDTEEIYTFDSSGRHLRTVDVWTKAVLWEFGYDADGNLITVRDVDDDETTIERAGEIPAAIISPNGQRTELAVNPDGYLASVTDPEGNAYQFTYSGGGLLTSMTNPNLDQYVFEYDTNGRLVKDTNPAGGFQALERIRLTGAEGFKVNITTKMGRVTSYETQELPEGGMKAIKKYPFGLEKVLIWRPDSSQSIWYVDGTVIDFQQVPDPQFGMQIPLPDLLSETIPSGLQRNLSLERDVQAGTITDLININDRTYTNIFNEVNKSFTLTTPEGRQKVVAINDQARVAGVQSGTLAPVAFTYNSEGEATAITIGSGADQRIFQFSYTDGLLSSMNDPLDGQISFQRDSAGRITGKTLQDGRSIGFTYDANGNVVSITPPGRPAHALSYTAIDNLSGYDPPDAGVSPDVTTISYNDDGQITGVVRPGGSSVAIGYYAGGRAASFTQSSGQKTTLSYDPDHAQLTGLSTSDGVAQTLTWDGFLQTGEAWSGPVAGSVEVSYNDYFQVDGMTVNGGSWRDFLYDNDGLLIAAEDLSMVRDENGLITATVIDTTTTATGYTVFGEQASFIARYDVDSLIEFTYTYDQSGRIAQKTETIDGSETTYEYSYDACGRLEEVVKDSTSVATYTYDDNSNRTSYTGDLWDNASGTYDDQDRMLSYGDATYTYAASGELLTKTVDTDTTTYSYDAIGNLRTVTLPDGTSIEYVIDGMNRRIGKKVNDTLVQGFIYRDLISPIAELDGSGTVVAELVYGSRPNVPDYMIKGGVTYRIISDHLGSPRLVVNTENGTVEQRIDYDEFGRIINDTNPEFQPFGFAGGLYDTDIGLVRFGARDYDPETGRWTTKDPILFSGGDTNLYGYVLADPVNLIDPSGYKHWYDYIPTGQGFVDAVGGVGDACLKFATFGILDPGKDMRQAFGADIVNECSETYRKTKKATEITLNTVSTCMGVSGFRGGPTADLTLLNQAGGAAKWAQTPGKLGDFTAGGISAITTLSGQ